MWFKLVVIVCLGGWCLASVEDEANSERSLKKNCDSSYSTTCLKLDIVSWVDKLNENEHFDLLPGVSLVRENSSSGARSNTADIVADLAREFPDDPDARLDAFLIKKVQSYLSTHSLKFDLYDTKNEAVSGRKASGGGGGGGGGGGKKGGGGMGGIIMAAAMMKSTMMALALGGIAAIAGKALMTGLISLLLSAIIGIKALSGGGGKTTYEVISKPVYTHSNSYSSSHEDVHGHGGGGGGGGGHSGYGRSFDTPLPLGLQPGYKPA